jgi:hypothetical protein
MTVEPQKLLGYIGGGGGAGTNTATTWVSSSKQ